MTSILNTALLQVNLHWEKTLDNIALFETLIYKLVDDVDLIVLPEMFTTGFSMNAESLAEPVQGSTLLWMKKMASEKNAAITGSIIVKEDDKFYNRMYFVFPDGTFQKYDKRHTFTYAKEDETYEAGNERLVVNYKGWRICPLVCYDLRFPVWARNTQNYDVLVYVANWPASRTLAWDTLLRARAIENMAYCLGVNRVGTDGNKLDYLGHSAGYDSLGQKISKANWETEFTEVLPLSKDHLDESRARFKFLQDQDKFTLH